MGIKSTKLKVAIKGSSIGNYPPFPTDGLIHFWRFNELSTSSQRVDAVAGLALDVKNTPRPSPPPLGLNVNRGTYFNSGQLTGLKATSSAASPNFADTTRFPTGFSIAGWVYSLPYPASDSNECIAGRWASDGSTDQWLLYRTTVANYWQMLIVLDDASFAYTLVGTVSGADENAPFYEWTHVVGMMDNRDHTLKVYLNGKLQQKVSFPLGRTIINRPSAEPLIIGSWSQGSGNPVTHGNAIIAGVGIWNRPLTTVEIDNLYNKGTGITY